MSASTPSGAAPLDAAAMRSVLHDSWQQLFVHSGDAHTALSAAHFDPTLQVPADAETLASAADVCVRSAGGNIWLELPGALVRLGPGRDCGRDACWYVNGRFAHLPAKLRQTALLLPLLWQLQPLGRHALHAASVRSPAGDALLLVGASGSGKSTTLATLCEAGWTLIADDISLWRLDGAEARVVPLARGLSLTADTPAPSGWQRLDGQACAGKWLLEPPHTATVEAPLRRLLFPSVVARAESRLQGLSPADALLALLPCAGGILTSPPAAHAGLAALATLCRQTPAWRLELGRDGFRNAKVLSRLLAA